MINSNLKQSKANQEEVIAVKRRKSIDINDILPNRYSDTKHYLFEPEPQRTPSCWSFFSFSKSNDSRKMSDVKASRMGSLLK